MVSPTKDTKLRGNDPTGHGYYGAKRGTKKHKGLDIIVNEGDDILSPINGHFRRIGRVYEHTDEFYLVELVNDTYSVKLMYVCPNDIKTNTPVIEGQIIGSAQDIAAYWGGKMLNHVHMEVRKHGLLTDPEPLIIKP